MSRAEIYTPKRSPRTVSKSIRGVEYSLTEWGNSNSPMIVWLHGFADTGTTLQFVVDALRDDWFVVAPDWRGFGGTRVETTAFWFPDYLADLDQLLQRYSPGRPVNLVGHSMGGNIAALYAGSVPERVAALVSIEGFGLPASDPDDAPGRYRDWLLGGRDLPSATVRDSYDALVAAIRRRNPRMRPDHAEYVAREWASELEDGRVQLRVHPAHKLPNPVLYRRAEAEACWRAVAAPVLLVAGRQSDFPDPGSLPFATARSAWIEDAGHMLHLEQPANLAKLVEAFLRDPCAEL